MSFYVLERCSQYQVPITFNLYDYIIVLSMTKRSEKLETSCMQAHVIACILCHAIENMPSHGTVRIHHLMLNQIWTLKQNLWIFSFLFMHLLLKLFQSMNQGNL